MTALADRLSTPLHQFIYLYSPSSVYITRPKPVHSHFTKTITNYQKADWTSFKQHVENIISCRSHSTNVHKVNKHLIKAILNADRLFIPKGNYNSSSHIHLPMYRPICKLIHHGNHICQQSRLDPQIITLNNYINKQIHEHKTNTWKQHLDKIDHKPNSHSLWATIAKLSNKKPPAHQNRSICFRTKTAITDMTEQKYLNKQFTNVTPYSK